MIADDKMRAKAQELRDARLKKQESEELAKSIADKISGVKVYQSITNKDDRKELADQLTGVFESIIKRVESGNAGVVEALSAFIQAYSSKEAQSTASIVKALQIALKEPKDKEKELDLDDYRPHDIEEHSGIQYIGFLNQEGDWYIIENSVQSGNLRYHFGKGNYQEAFEKARGLEYKILSEAV